MCDLKQIVSIKIQNLSLTQAWITACVRLFFVKVKTSFFNCEGRGGGAGSAGSESRSGDSYTFSGVSVQIGSNLNEEEMALAIGRRFLSEIKQSFQNRG